MKPILIILTVLLLLAASANPQGHGRGSAYRQTIRVEWSKYGPCIWDYPNGYEGPKGCVGPPYLDEPGPHVISIEWKAEGLIIR